MKTYDFKKKKSLVDHAKGLMMDMVTTYSKQQLSKHVEKNIAKKVKREVKKYTFSLVSLSIILVGLLFLFYGMLSMIVALLELPNYVTSFSFGVLLLFVGLIIYLLRP